MGRPISKNIEGIKPQSPIFDRVKGGLLHGPSAPNNYAFQGFRRDEKDRRKAKSNCTAALMGDPPPHRSALFNKSSEDEA